MVITCSHLTNSSKFPVFREYNRIKHLIVEIIPIIILSRLSGERDKAPILAKALGPAPVGLCLKMSLVDVLGVRTLMPLNTSCVDGLMHIKSVLAQISFIGMEISRGGACSCVVHLT
ncbi:hypothetical protein TNCV_1653221 [Trichonephila clavipes]|nr:hypothetical protein TNCV_1653221 [Trichonephila clavipes]